MSRHAVIISLTLHAVLLLLIGMRSPATATHADSGVIGVGVSFLAEPRGAPLLVEATPIEEPPAAAETPEVEPPANPPAPPVLTASIPTSNIPREEYHPDLPAIALKATRSAHRSAASANEGRKSGADANGSGANLAGSGRGGGAGYTPPQFRLRYKPPYPDEARAQRLEGMVLLLVRVDADGRVIEAGIRQSCGHALLDRAALEAVRSWRFYPARQDGAAIAAQVEVPVSFRFEERRTAST